jgi:hypothetical protein
VTRGKVCRGGDGRCKGPEVGQGRLALQNIFTSLPAPFLPQTDRHKCRPPKPQRAHSISPQARDPAAVSLTLNTFFGLICHPVASKLSLLQKNGMGWGGLGGVASPRTAKSGHGVIFKPGKEVFIVPRQRRARRVEFFPRGSVLSCPPW